MSDDDLELEQDSSEVEELPTESPGSRDANYWEKQARKFKEEAVARKVENGRLRVAAKHGIDPDSIPDYVPLSGMDEFVAKFLAKPDPTVPTQTEAPEQDEAEPAEQAVSEAERNLAAVVQGSVSPGSPQSSMSEDEIRALAKADPARYAALRATGAIPPPPRIGADYRGR